MGQGGKGEMGGRGSYPLPSSWLNAAEHVQGVGLGFHSSVANTVRIWQCFCFWCAQVELATRAAVWGCCFLNSSPSSPPQDPFSIIEVVSAGPPALCIWGNVPKGVAEQRAHPLGCLGGLNVVRYGGTGDPNFYMTQAWGYLAMQSFQCSFPLQKIKKKKRNTSKIWKCTDFLTQLSSQSV